MPEHKHIFIVLGIYITLDHSSVCLCVVKKNGRKRANKVFLVIIRSIPPFWLDGVEHSVLTYISTKVGASTGRGEGLQGVGPKAELPQVGIFFQTQFPSLLLKKLEIEKTETT